MKKSKPKMTYEPEADVLIWEISKRPIEYATEIGNVIVHFSSEGIPVLLEMLEAKNFLKQVKQTIGLKSPQEMGAPA